MFQRSCWFTALTREIFSTLEENFRVSARQFNALCISIYCVLSIALTFIFYFSFQFQYRGFVLVASLVIRRIYGTHPGD